MTSVEGWLLAFMNTKFFHRYMNLCVCSRTFMSDTLFQISTHLKWLPYS